MSASRQADSVPEPRHSRQPAHSYGARQNWHVEDDGYNRLILRAGLSWREITVLRAIARYLRQAVITFNLLRGPG